MGSLRNASQKGGCCPPRERTGLVIHRKNRMVAKYAFRGKSFMKTGNPAPMGMKGTGPIFSLLRPEKMSR